MHQLETLTDKPAARRRTRRLLAAALILLGLALALPSGVSALLAGSGGWSGQTSGSQGTLHAVAFCDSSHGWAVGEGGAILASTTGGAAWGAQSSGSYWALYGVAFSDRTHGCAVGWNGVIRATACGGLPPAPSTPVIAKLKPASAKHGALVTISGSDCGAARGTGSVKFGGKNCTACVSRHTTQIKCRVPAAAKYGKAKVTVTTTGKSNAVSFSVKR